jgi:hypothetical protein
LGESILLDSFAPASDRQIFKILLGPDSLIAGKEQIESGLLGET